MAQIHDRKSRVFDHISNYRFHVLDVSFTAPVVFNVSFGFRSVSSPELTIESKQIKEGNFEYKKTIPVAAEASEIVLEQGVSIFNSDFHDWILRAVRGESNVRRNLLLIQMSEVSLLDTRANLNLGIGPLSVFNFNDIIGRVPSKAWMLRGCLPIRYKAGTDFDAMGGEISIASLVIKPYYFDELSLGV